MRIRRYIVLLALMIGVFASDVIAGWGDDWFDQAVSSGPSSYNSQTRGFYSAGSFSARRRMTNDFLVTLAPPRISAGCGGIDIFNGGFSFLDSEYLVEKFQRILQATPGMAFHMALQEFCKPCVSGLESLETITNQINQLQMNDCQAARGLATAIVHPNQVAGKVRGMLAQGLSLTKNLRKNSQAFKEEVDDVDGKAPDDTSELIEDCPNRFKDVFGGGSVLANITTKLGLNSYTDEMRGLVGDAKVSYNASRKQHQVRIFSSCPANDEADTSLFNEGVIYKMNSSGACTRSTWGSISDEIEDNMEAISIKLMPGNKSPLTNDEIEFINAAPFPVLNILRDGVSSHTVESKINIMISPLTIAYAYRIFDDLLKTIRITARKANEVYDNTESTGPDKCQPKVVDKALRHFQKMEPLLSDYRNRAQSQYTARINEANQAIAFAQSQLEARRRHLVKSSMSESK